MVLSENVKLIKILNVFLVRFIRFLRKFWLFLRKTKSVTSAPGRET